MSLFLTEEAKSIKTWRLQGSTDWPMWKQEMEMILDYLGLWEVVNIENEEIDDKKANLTDFDKKDKKSRAIIWTSISKEIQPIFLGKTDTSARIWNRLKKEFDRQSATTRFRLEEELDNLYLLGCKDEADYSHRFQGLVKQIGMTGEPLSQATQIRIFLKNAGSAYETWVKLKKISAREKLPELEDLANDLVDEATDHKDKDFEHQARFTSKRPWKGQHQTEIGKKCFHCGKQGHFIKECEDFLDEIRQQVKTGKSSTQGAGSPGARALSVSHRPERAW